MPDGERALQLSQLNLTERAGRKTCLQFHRTLLKVRREDPVFAAQNAADLRGVVLSDTALALRYLGPNQEGDRLILLNLGRELQLSPCPHPLLAPPPRRQHWVPMLSSEEVRFGGSGATYPGMEGDWRLSDSTAVVMKSVTA